MKIIRKLRGHHPEAIELDKEEVKAIYDSGNDRMKLFKSFYIISKYNRERTEKTLNTSVIIPHLNITHFYGDVYIIKKGLFGVKGIKDSELTYLIALFTYDSDSIKEKRVVRSGIDNQNNMTSFLGWR